MKQPTITRRGAIQLALAFGVGALTSCGIRGKTEDPHTVHLAAGEDFSTMDVAETSNFYMIPINVFDRLFETRRVNGEATLVNSLCESYTMADDARHFDFVLRDGVVFSNGDPLTSADVKYTFERLLKKARENTDIPLEVEGGQDVMDGKADSLAGFNIIDDTHFSIVLAEPNVGFVAELSSPAVSIVNAKSVEKVAYFGHEPADTIGSGPYIIEDWITSDHYTLVYNERYWGEPPSVRKAIVHIVPDASTQNLMFKNNELDIINLGILNSAIVQNDYKPNYADHIITSPTASIHYFALNENNTFLKDLRVRQAIAHAIDVESIIAHVYYGDATPEHGIIPAGVWGANPDLKGYDYNPDAARALLSEAGYSAGEVNFELAMVANDGKPRLVCESIQSDLAKVGITIHIKSYDSAAFVQKRMASELESFVTLWLLDYNDPANIMATFFGSPQRTAQRSMNYPNTEVMKRVMAASSIVDDNERKAEYQDLEKKIAVDDCAWVPLFEEKRVYCTSAHIANFVPHWAGYGDFYVSDITMAEQTTTDGK